MKKALFTLGVAILTVSSMAKEYCQVITMQPGGGDRCEFIYGTDDPRNERLELEYTVDVLNLMEERGYEFIGRYMITQSKDELLFVKND